MVTSWRRMTSRFRHGLGTAGPPRPLQADTPVTWVTKSKQRKLVTEPRMGGFLNERIEASFCIAQRRRTEFLCSEKEGTARGTRGRFELCIGITFRNPTLVTTSPAAGPQRARDAGLGLEVTERVPSGDLVPQPRKQTARRDQERQLLAIQSEAGNAERSGANRSGAERSGAERSEVEIATSRLNLIGFRAARRQHF